LLIVNGYFICAIIVVTSSWMFSFGLWFGS